MRRKHHMWTKQELKQFTKIWDSKTAEEIAKEFGVKTHTVTAMAGKFRKLGVKLTSKRRTGYLDSLMKEVAREIK